MKATIATLAAFLCTMAHGQQLEPPQVPLMLPPGDPYGQSFVRLVSLTQHFSEEVRITAIDDGGNVYDPVTVQLEGNQVFHFNSDDLAYGNTLKGIVGGIGAPRQGNWRLHIELPDVFIWVQSFIRTRDGFLTSVSDMLVKYRNVHEDGKLYESLHAFTFNPASNTRQQSVLRLINWGDSDETITIVAIDDTGVQTDNRVTLTLPAGQARMLSAVDLEEGGTPADVHGWLGDGTGKWRLEAFYQRVDVADPDPWLESAPGRIDGQSLIYSASGHISNLSGMGALGTRTSFYTD